MRKTFFDILDFAVGRLPDSVLHKLEISAIRAQGHGYTLGSVDSEVEICLFLLGEIDESNLIVVDGGSNNGLWTDALLQRISPARIVLIEPSAIASQRLRKKYCEHPNVEVLETALGSDEGLGILLSDHDASPLATMWLRPEWDDPNMLISDEIVISTLDKLFVSADRKPSLIKLDVEGSELAALMGAKQILDKVSVIQFEFGGCNVDSRVFFLDLWNFLNSEGFKIFRNSSNGLRPIDTYDYKFETFATTNYWALSNRMNLAHDDKHRKF